MVKTNFLSSLNQKYNIIFSLLLIITNINHSHSEKIDINSYELDSSPKDLRWCGAGNKIAFMLTLDNSLYKTEDKGKHWKKMNDLFTNLGKEELEEKETEVGKVSSIIQSNADPTILILLGTKGINWIAKDCGNSIIALNHGRKINEYIPHPTEKNWGLATAFTICDDFLVEPCKIYKEVFVTKDLGKNWEQIGKYVTQVGWGIVEQKQIDKGVPKQRILMTYEPKGKGDQKIIGWNYKVDFVYSDDFFKTTNLAMSKGNQFFLTNHYLFVVSIADQATDEVILYGSKSTHFNYDFRIIETNQKSFLEHSYTFLDSTFHSVFLYINHFGEKSPYGHVYTSGARGLKYNLSLRNIVSGGGNQCDFEKVISVEGVYVANVISGKYIKLSKKEMTLKIINAKESLGNSKNTTSTLTKKQTLSYKDYIKTKITFNRGASWERIKAPERDSENKKYNCGNYCYLNLFGLSSDYTPFYSVDSAAGLIIGNGNVGRYLNKEISTFMSRDGGLNWFEIKKGSHTYEIGNDGSLILLADDQQPSNIIHYSYDEGLSWEDLKICDEKFLIKNIVIEPTSSSHYFIVYGDKMIDGKNVGIAISVDFEEFLPQCKNPDKPNTADSDYEIWTPSNGRSGDKCLLGHKTEIIRKKRSSKCVNSENFIRKIEKSNCECTILDYQCDLGYERPENSEKCENTEQGLLSEKIIKPPDDCKDTYKITQGYRKIPGNTCQGGVQLDPIVMKCPTVSKFSNMGLILFIIVLIVIIGVGYVLVDKKANLTCEFDFSSLRELINKFYEGVGKSASYEQLQFSQEDNTLFDDDDKIINPPIKMKKKDKKNENKELKELKELEEVKEVKNNSDNNKDSNNDFNLLDINTDINRNKNEPKELIDLSEFDEDNKLTSDGKNK